MDTDELPDFSVPKLDDFDDDDDKRGDGHSPTAANLADDGELPSSTVITITMGEDPTISGVLDEIAASANNNSSGAETASTQKRGGRSSNELGGATALVAGVLAPAALSKLAHDAVDTITKDGLKNIRPWSEFFASDKIGLPRPREVVHRIPSNLRYYQSNYLFVFFSLALYSVITTPGLLFVALAMGVLAIYLLYLRTEPIVLFGVPLSDQHRASIVLGMALFLCVFTSAASTLLWIVSFAVVLVAVHSSLWKPTEEDLFV